MDQKLLQCLCMLMVHMVSNKVLTPFLGTCPGWQDRVAVQYGLLMRMVADEGEVECD